MVLLNSDMGESFGIHSFGNDENLLSIIDTANVACGFHAGDPSGIQRTIAGAAAHDVKVGAHPGLPDLVGFGRREMALTSEEVYDAVLYQVGALTGFLSAEGLSLNHLKAHGALYGMSARDEDVMAAICRAAKVFGVPIYGMPGTAHERVCNATGVPFVAELYVDLPYRDDGSLKILRRPQATDIAVAAEQARSGIQEGWVASENGKQLPIRVETVCVHSDTPNAVDVAKTVRAVIAATAAHA